MKIGQNKAVLQVEMLELMNMAAGEVVLLSLLDSYKSQSILHLLLLMDK